MKDDALVAVGGMLLFMAAVYRASDADFVQRLQHELDHAPGLLDKVPEQDLAGLRDLLQRLLKTVESKI